MTPARPRAAPTGRTSSRGGALSAFAEIAAQSSCVGQSGAAGPASRDSTAVAHGSARGLHWRRRVPVPATRYHCNAPS
ncbi:hypothetical protein HR51_28310 [Burkholderia cepacia]|nr:hypothetical protein HR51_28310 [Burkholderia cepacia]